MKRIAALALALMMLLAWAGAWAEPMCTEMDLDRIRLSLIGSDNKEVARLHDIGMSIMVGSVENMPTLQIALNYGEGQELDTVFQLNGDQLLMCFGGISGTFYVNLDDVVGEGKGKLVSAAVGTAMNMFASNPQAVLGMVMESNGKGVLRKTFRFSKEQYIPAVERAIERVGSTGALAPDNAKALRQLLYESKRHISLTIRYSAEKNRIRVQLKRDGKGLQLRCKLFMITEPMQLINLSTDEVKYNLLDMDPQTLEELRGEAQFLDMKLDTFVDNSTLSKLAD